MTDMTEYATRRALKAFRLGRRLSFDALYADIRAVLKRERLSPRTLSRFEKGTGHAHPHTVADINDYLAAVAAQDRHREPLSPKSSVAEAKA